MGNVRTELLQLRALAADWMNGAEPAVDSALYGKKAAKDEEKIQFPSRPVGPSQTQLVLIRNIVFGLVSLRHHIQANIIDKKR